MLKQYPEFQKHFEDILNNYDKKNALRKYIEEIATQRVEKANVLIEAYHRKSEIALDMLPPPGTLKTNEKLYEIEETLGSFDNLPQLQKISGKEEVKSKSMEVDQSFEQNNPQKRKFRGNSMQNIAANFEENPYKKPFKIEARDIILRNFLQSTQDQKLAKNFQ
jgi:hypothetical protein